MQAFLVEHILPRSRGGNPTLDNLALACQGCNNHKYTKTDSRDPVGRQTVHLFHPRHHQWSQHFVWNSDYRLILGLTPTGRATVEALRIGRAWSICDACSTQWGSILRPCLKSRSPQRLADHLQNILGELGGLPDAFEFSDHEGLPRVVVLLPAVESANQPCRHLWIERIEG